MKKLLSILTVAALFCAFSLSPALAMKKDSGSMMKDDGMKKESMKDDGMMKQDKGMKKGEMMKDDGMMKKDDMKKGDMKKM